MKFYHSKKQNVIPEKQNGERVCVCVCFVCENLLCMLYINIQLKIKWFCRRIISGSSHLKQEKVHTHGKGTGSR